MTLTRRLDGFGVDGWRGQRTRRPPVLNMTLILRWRGRRPVPVVSGREQRGGGAWRRGGGRGDRVVGGRGGRDVETVFAVSPRYAAHVKLDGDEEKDDEPDQLQTRQHVEVVVEVTRLADLGEERVYLLIADKKILQCILSCFIERSCLTVTLRILDYILFIN